MTSGYSGSPLFEGLRDWPKPKCTWPEYVWIMDKTDPRIRKALKRSTHGGSLTYYRHAGAWDCHAKRRPDGSMYATATKRPMIHHAPLIPCTEQEWRDDNKGYV